MNNKINKVVIMILQKQKQKLKKVVHFLNIKPFFKMINNKRNNLISNQDNKIESGNNEIISRNRQVEFTEERTRYRQIMIITLIIVNVLLASGLYYLLKGSK